MIRIIIADDMKDFRDHFTLVFNNEDDFEVLATANCEKKVIELANKLQPDVVLMDVQMDSDESGVIAMKEILKTNPNIKVIMLTIHSDRENIVKAFEYGAYDFIDKTSSTEDIVRTVRSAALGEAANDSAKKVNRVMIEEFMKMKKERESILYMITILSRLSITELEVLKGVASGKKYRDIAGERVIEEATVRTIASRICSKLGIRPLKEVVRIVNQYNILDLFDELNDKK